MKRVTVDFQDELHMRLKIQCVRDDLRLTELIRRLAEEHLAKVEKRPDRIKPERKKR
jgi:ParG